jgi:hypothetical protein
MTNEQPPPGLKEFLESLAIGIDKILNGNDVEHDKSLRKNGFVLLIFPYDREDARCNYISNGAQRADIIQMFKDQIKHFEEQGNEGNSNPIRFDG